MAQVRLTKGLRLPGRGLLFPGAVFEPTPEEREVIERVGAAGVVPEAEPSPAEDAEPSPAEDAEPSPAEDDEEPVEEAPDRPKQAENLETWQTYARALGIDTKGMSKQEIIAATK